MRPKLNQHIKTKEFLSYYWLKKELQGFCHDHHIPRSGSKAELTERIHLFLQTGEIKRPVHKKTGAPNGNKLEELSLDTVITKHHRCNQSVRTFFKTIIPNFHFSTYIQNYFKQNSGKTYRDVVTAWYEEESRKKILPISEKLEPSLNITSLQEISLQTQPTKGKAVQMQLQRGVQ